MITGLESISAVSHWLNTPVGSYCGFPTYGFSGKELLYKNSHDAVASLDTIYNKMKKDLGGQIIKTVLSMEVKTLGEEYYLIVYLSGNKITGVQVL